MTQAAKFAVLLGALLAVLAANTEAFAQAAGPLVVGYVYPGEHLLKPGSIDPFSMSRINFAFAKIETGRMVESHATDAPNLAALTALRKQNPHLAVLVSVGGWGNSAHFSDLALTAQSRRIFADSVMVYLRSYDLDGLDVDWEYPGQSAAGRHSRVTDKQNFTLLLQALRQRFDREKKNTHHQLYLTIAAGGDQEYLDNTEMDKVQRSVDSVYLMTYDMSDASYGDPASHHAALFTNPASPQKASADATVQAFLKAGVPAARIVLGVPFYGHAWGEVSAQNHGLFQHGRSNSLNYATYATIAGTLPAQGFVRYWDPVAKAPYLYNAEKKIFVSYDDPESLSVKCDYVLSHKLGGMMFWQYSGDDQGALLKTIDDKLKPAAR